MQMARATSKCWQWLLRHQVSCFICASLFNPSILLIRPPRSAFSACGAPSPPWLSPEQPSLRSRYRLCQIRTDQINAKYYVVSLALCQLNRIIKTCVVDLAIPEHRQIVCRHKWLALVAYPISAAFSEFVARLWLYSPRPLKTPFVSTTKNSL